MCVRVVEKTPETRVDSHPRRSPVFRGLTSPNGRFREKVLRQYPSPLSPSPFPDTLTTTDPPDRRRGTGPESLDRRPGSWERTLPHDPGSVSTSRTRGPDGCMDPLPFGAGPGSGSGSRGILQTRVDVSPFTFYRRAGRRSPPHRHLVGPPTLSTGTRRNRTPTPGTHPGPLGW